MTWKYSVCPAAILALLVVAVGLVPIKNETTTSQLTLINTVVLANAADCAEDAETVMGD